MLFLFSPSSQPVPLAPRQRAQQAAPLVPAGPKKPMGFFREGLQPPLCQEDEPPQVADRLLVSLNYQMHAFRESDESVAERPWRTRAGRTSAGSNTFAHLSSGSPPR